LPAPARGLGICANLSALAFPMVAGGLAIAILGKRADDAAYKDTIEWMYSDPAALKIFSEFTNLPESVVSKVRELVPKETLVPDRIVGVDQIIAEAVGTKFLAAPLTLQQVKELIQIPQ
jgi:hypothetical protein